MGLNVLARYIELERKLIEQEELERRIEALEAGRTDQAGGQRWWA